VFYDQLNPTGAFSKESKVSIKASVKAIKEHGGEKVDSYLNSLRYISIVGFNFRFATIHYNDESTPKTVKAALG
jgi:hypothetical protein